MKIEGDVGTVVTKPSSTVAKIAPWASVCDTYMTGISIAIDDDKSVSNPLGIANSSFSSSNQNTIKTDGSL
jgi:hypothetical protein